MSAPAPRGRFALVVIILFGLFSGLLALGTWQLQRRAWKLDLIERVDARVHAPPVAPPAPRDWPLVSAARDEYRHVAVSGRFFGARDTRVQAVTELGAGFWLLRPLQQHDGSIVLINRGFVPIDGKADDAMARDAPVAITGLLRLSEPHGGFLRRNDPAAGRWYSRDVAAIAAAHGLRDVAPYFIDADARPADANAMTHAARRWPAGGLTVVRFRNSHLSYALTWYALALLVAFAGWRVVHEQRRLHASAAYRPHGRDTADRGTREQPHHNAAPRPASPENAACLPPLKKEGRGGFAVEQAKANPPISPFFKGGKGENAACLPPLKKEGRGGFAVERANANPPMSPLFKDGNRENAACLPPLKKEGWGGFAVEQAKANPPRSPFFKGGESAQEKLISGCSGVRNSSPGDIQS